MDRSPVTPVANYGMELFAWSDADCATFDTKSTSAWRDLLRIGKRAPCDITTILMGLQPHSQEWKSRRLGLFIRLMNSPSDSWQHSALIMAHSLQIDWHKNVLADFKHLFPGLIVTVVDSQYGLLLHSNGYWSDEGRWLSAVAYNLPQDFLGRRHRILQRHGSVQSEVTAVRVHAGPIHTCSDSF